MTTQEFILLIYCITCYLIAIGITIAYYSENRPTVSKFIANIFFFLLAPIMIPIKVGYNWYLGN